MSVFFTLIVLLIVMGLLYWLVTLLPLPEPFPVIIKVVVILLVIYVLLSTFGMAPAIPHLHT